MKKSVAKSSKILLLGLLFANFGNGLKLTLFYFHYIKKVMGHEN